MAPKAASQVARALDVGRATLYWPSKQAGKDKQVAVASTRWMITELSKRYPERSKPISHETISRWREAGLLPYTKDDYPDPDRAIAMLVLRSLTTDKVHAWTPKVPPNGDFWNEALWLCWRQDTPASPIVPCTIPLPANPPHHAIL